MAVIRPNVFRWNESHPNLRWTFDIVRDTRTGTALVGTGPGYREWRDAFDAACVALEWHRTES